ncbi:MAG: amino acid adenylation domain-containing protein [Ktedonobacteraceae bacterium]
MQDETFEGFRLSPQQRHLWLLQQQMSDQCYCTQCFMLIQGPLDIAILHMALEKVVERYEILRTTFHVVPGMALPLQCIAAHDEVALPQYDLRSLPFERQQQELDRMFNGLLKTSWQLRYGPLFPASLLLLAPQKYILLLHVSAFCVDAASLTILTRDISAAYLACLNNDEHQTNDLIQYADLSEWLNETIESVEAHEMRERWNQQDTLTGLDLRLPFEITRTTEKGFVPRSFATLLDDNLLTKITALAHDLNISLPTLLIACWQILLWRFTKQTEVTVGVAYDGREAVELRDVPGLLTKYLPHHCHFTDHFRLCDIVEQTETSRLEATQWQQYYNQPLLFPASFDFSEQAATSTIGEIRFTLAQSYSCIEPFDIKLSCLKTQDNLSLTFHYNTCVFLDDRIPDLADQYLTLLESVTTNPEVSLQSLNTLSTNKRRQLLVYLNATESDYPRDTCVQQLFEEQVERVPDSIALVFEEQQLTYNELNARANQLAHHLRMLHVGAEVVVGLYMERSPESIIGLLAVLKADGAYLPIEPTSPRERIAFILKDADVSIVLTQHSLLEHLSEQDRAVLCCDRDWEVIARLSRENIVRRGTSDNLAYIIYTSGSTGQPKGVMIPHRGLMNYLNWSIRAYNVAHGQGSVVHSPLSFDLTITSLLPTLLVGRSVMLLPEDQGIELLKTALTTRDHFSLIKVTPAHMDLLSELFEQRDVADITNSFVIGGEALYSDSIAPWRDHAPATLFVNEYGPTETVVGCCVYFVPAEQSIGPVPIGRPIANTQIYLLDADLQPVSCGITAEIYIGGDGLARGYVNGPALTAERFLPHPYSSQPGVRLYKTGDLARHQPDGTIEYIGRNDEQVKLRGFRIELGEIETRQNQHPAIQESLVLLKKDEYGQKQLVSYLVPNKQAYTVQRLLHLKRQGLLTERSFFEMPNGMIVNYLNKNELDYLYKDIFEAEAYLKHGITVNDGDTIFDVGANIGLFSLFIGQKRQNVHIYAFEPLPPLAQILRVNASLYDCDLNVFEHGLSNESKMEDFYYYPHLSLMSGRFTDQTDEKEVVKHYLLNGQQIEATEDEFQSNLDDLLNERLIRQRFSCPVRRLSEVMREQQIEHIDLLKIDVEKSELDVLAGIEGEDWQKIQQLVIEIHDIERRLEQVIRLLQTHGYQIVFEQERILQGTNLYNLYARRSLSKQDQSSVARASREHWYSPTKLTNDLRAFLGQTLPEYMIPNSFILLETLPLTPHGKVDRQALSRLEWIEAEQPRPYLAPRTPIEIVLVGLWERALHRERASIEDNFFESGGHSLLAMQLITWICDSFSLRLPVGMLFEAPTVEKMAEKLEALGRAEQIDISEIAQIILKVNELSDDEARELLASNMGPRAELRKKGGFYE